MSEPLFQLKRPVKIGDAINQGLETFKAQAGMYIGLFVLALVAMMIPGGILSFIVGFASLALFKTNPTAVALTIQGLSFFIIDPILFLIQGIAMYPLFRAILYGQDKRKFEFGNAFEPFGVHMRYGLAALVVGYVTAIANLIMTIPRELVAAGVRASGPTNPLMELVATSPFILGTLVISLGILPFIGLFPYIVVDNPKLGVFKCLNVSFKAGLSNYFPLFGLVFVSYLIMGLGVIACFVGLLATVPLGFCILGAGYRQLVPGVGTMNPDEAKQAKLEAMTNEQEGYIENDGGWDQTKK